MGHGGFYKCSKCGEEYYANTGIGMMFPTIYKSIQNEVSKGKYGKEWQELYNSEPLVAADAEVYLYVCKKCNYWETDYGLSLYAPNDLKTLKKKRYGEKTVEGWGMVPYASGDDFKEDYHLLKRRIHKCEKCGSVMHKSTKQEEDNLPCPVCGGPPEEGGASTIMWD